MATKKPGVERLERIRAELERRQLDGLMISAPHEENLGGESRFYASGFTGSTGVVVITLEGAFIAADFRYTEQAENECAPRGFTVFPALGGAREWFPKFVEASGMAGKRIGLASRDMTYAGRLALGALSRRLPPAARPLWRPAPDVISGLRARKDAEELQLLQAAVDVSDRAFNDLEAALEPSLTELAVAEQFERNVRAAGSDGVSFDTIVAAGPNGAMPHASPTHGTLGQSRPVVIDMGAKLHGYCSDLTRTVVLGEADAKFREIYDIVFEAQQTAIERVEPGMRSDAAHQLAQEVIDRAGYGERFGHGLGHGIGLAVHEAPHLGKTGRDTLEEGMVFTIEPGIYLPGWGGVRIEDMVVLENGRARVMSKANKRTPAGVTS